MGGGMRNVYNILVYKPERKRALRIPRYKWYDNIKWILKNERFWTGFM
jgi:hypothetical protein